MSWRRGKADAQDLRERVLAAVDDGLAVTKVAALFKVSVSYVSKVRLRGCGPARRRRDRSGVTSAGRWLPITMRS